MKRARLVTAANSFIAEHARAYNRNVEVVPSCVDPSRQPLRQHSDQETVQDRLDRIAHDSRVPEAGTARDSPG